jgi:uncharacterized damage-inducible protein DinB
MSIAQSLLQELEREAATTRRVLERVPTGQLNWKPHIKSMSLGQLALHVATTPGGVARLVETTPCEMPTFGAPEPKSTDDVMAAFEASLADATRILSSFDDARMLETWQLMRDGQPLMSVPRVGVIRSILLNHWYHHRGQLSVYLRELNVPLPSIYGPSADENPFA